MSYPAATILNDLATAIAGLINQIPDLKVYDYEGRDLDQLPCVTVGAQTVERVSPEGVESELGSDDWRITTRVMVYDACDDPQTAWQSIRSLIPQVIQAIEADRGLANIALDSTVTSSSTGFTEADEAGRQMVVAEIDVEALCLVTLTAP